MSRTSQRSSATSYQGLHLGPALMENARKYGARMVRPSQALGLLSLERSSRLASVIPGTTKMSERLEMFQKEQCYAAMLAEAWTPK